MNAAYQRALNLNAVSKVEAQRFSSQKIDMRYVEFKGTYFGNNSALAPKSVIIFAISQDARGNDAADKESSPGNINPNTLKF